MTYRSKTDSPTSVLKSLMTFSLVLSLSAITATAKPPPGKGPGSGGGGGDDGGSAPIDYRGMQQFPIKLGTSGGWADDLANGYCCGGTLGALVEIGSSKYILSNFHVLAADVVSGGNGETASVGDDVIQPGLIDINCNLNNTTAVATLSDWANPLNGTNIDAALAEIITGAVASDGEILGIGTLSSDTLPPSVGLRVKKSGRTTGLTTSKIDALNVSVNIIYENECAGQSIGTGHFTGQILIANKGSKFLGGGDSGSVMVENVGTNPRAVGLLYAGSRSSAIANPIGDVLAHFGATMVGVSGSASSSSSTTTASGPSRGNGLANAIAAQERNRGLLESVPNGVGHGIGRDTAGKPIIKVFVESDAPGARRALHW